jgi:hypothetical protein
VKYQFLKTHVCFRISYSHLLENGYTHTQWVLNPRSRCCQILKLLNNMESKGQDYRLVKDSDRQCYNIVSLAQHNLLVILFFGSNSKLALDAYSSLGDGAKVKLGLQPGIRGKGGFLI